MSKTVPRDMKKCLEMMHVFIFLIMMMIPYVYTCIKSYQAVHFNYVLFIIYQLYRNKAIKTFKEV